LLLFSLGKKKSKTVVVVGVTTKRKDGGREVGKEMVKKKRGREEVERVRVLGASAHEGKALLCSYSVSGRLSDVTTTLDSQDKR
jgi:hypothetical protein